ncbi:MAG: hypothetical protein IKP42_08305 [Ruminococcus sp.]|nr:hypothetical protein [Ruminococcus sp.]
MKKEVALLASFFMCVSLISCSADDASSVVQQSVTSSSAAEQSSDPAETTAQTSTETAQQETTGDTQPENTQDTSSGQSGSEAAAITKEQALDAVRNYCFIQDPGLKNMTGSDEYTIYWDVISESADEIVVLYRSYTGAQMRYYISPVSGETYVTAQVPGIIDEEKPTDKSFNIKDYLT